MDNAFLKALSQMEGSVFQQKLDHALRDVALGTASNGYSRKKGKLTIELTLERINDSTQVMVNHKIVQVKPTMNGKSTEETTTSTPMHVGSGGVMSLSPENQADMFEDDEKVTRFNND